MGGSIQLSRDRRGTNENDFVLKAQRKGNQSGDHERAGQDNQREYRAEEVEDLIRKVKEVYLKTPQNDVSYSLPLDESYVDDSVP